MSSYDRKAGIQIDLTEFGEVSEVVPFEDYMEIIQKDSISRIRLPETIDPDCKAPELRPEIISEEYGASNEIVARLYLQQIELMNKFCPFPEDVKRQVLLILSECRANLISANNKKDKIIAGINAVYDKYSDGVQLNSDNTFRVDKVHNLEQDLKDFVDSLFSYYKYLIKILKPLYGVEINVPNYKVAVKELKKIIPEDEEMYKFLLSNHKAIDIVSKIRNKLWHPSTKDYVSIKNFRLTESGKIFPPSWHLFINNNCIFENSIENDLKHLCTHALDFGELFSICYIQRIKEPKMFTIGLIEEIPKDKRNPNKPVRFNVIQEFLEPPQYPNQ